MNERMTRDRSVVIADVRRNEDDDDRNRSCEIAHDDGRDVIPNNENNGSARLNSNNAPRHNTAVMRFII